MIVTLSPTKLFVAHCAYEERHELKNRGWTFENGLWWTNDANKLMGLPCTQEALDHGYFKLNRFAKSSSVESDFVVPETKPFAPYQRAAIEIMTQEFATLLADPPGVGKTATAVGYCNLTKPQKVLAIVPASVRLNWLKEFREWSSHTYVYMTIEGRKLDNIPPYVNVIIASYDVLTQPYLMQLLNDWKPDVLITDEGHFLKDPKAQRTKSIFSKYPFKDVKHIHGLIHCCKKYIDITGTPALNRPVEFYPLLSTCARLALEPYSDLMSYGKHFCKGFKARFGWVFTGSSNEDQLNRILRESIMIRRDKAKILPQLPAKRFQIIELDPSKVETLLTLEHQLDSEVNHRTWVENLDTKIAANSLKRADDTRPLIAQLSDIKQEIALSKMPYVIEIIDNVVRCDEKVVVFAVHKAVVSALEEALCEYNPAKIVGGQTQTKRDQEIKRFINDPNCKIIIGNIEAAGVGIDGLQHVANHVVFAEINQSPYALEQAMDRLCRRGQTSSVLARFIAYTGSVDQYMLQSNVAKEKVLEKLLK